MDSLLRTFINEAKTRVNDPKRDIDFMAAMFRDILLDTTGMANGKVARADANGDMLAFEVKVFDGEMFCSDDDTLSLVFALSIAQSGDAVLKYTLYNEGTVLAEADIPDIDDFATCSHKLINDIRKEGEKVLDANFRKLVEKLAIAGARFMVHTDGHVGITRKRSADELNIHFPTMKEKVVKGTTSWQYI